MRVIRLGIRTINAIETLRDPFTFELSGARIDDFHPRASGVGRDH